MKEENTMDLTDINILMSINIDDDNHIIIANLNNGKYYFLGYNQITGDVFQYNGNKTHSKVGNLPVSEYLDTVNDVKVISTEMMPIELAINFWIYPDIINLAESILGCSVTKEVSERVNVMVTTLKDVKFAIDHWNLSLRMAIHNLSHDV